MSVVIFARRTVSAFVSGIADDRRREVLQRRDLRPSRPDHDRTASGERVLIKALRYGVSRKVDLDSVDRVRGQHLIQIGLRDAAKVRPWKAVDEEVRVAQRAVSIPAHCAHHDRATSTRWMRAWMRGGCGSTGIT